MLSNHKINSEFQNENEAWKKLQQGSLNALGFFYDRYVDDLFTIGISIRNDRELIEDIIHDLFIDVFKYHQNLSSITNVKAYLITSYKRKLFKSLSSNEIALQVEDIEKRLETLNSELDVESSIINLERASLQKKKLQNAWKYLTPHQIKALKLKFMENKTYSEIAIDLNVSIASARTLIYRSVKEIRRRAVSILF